MEIKFSIIMPVYNEGHRLVEAVDSLYRQTYSSYELIIVDDGSTDQETIRLIEECQDQYGWIKMIHQENRGVSSARNAGMRAVTGDYVVFLDADDRLPPNALSSMRDVLEQQAGERLDMVLSNYENIQVNKGRVVQRSFFDRIAIYDVENRDELIRLLYCNGMESGKGGCFSYEVIQKSALIFREDLNVCEDIDWFLKMFFLSKKIATIPKFNYEYLTFGKKRITKLERYISQTRATAYWVKKLRNYSISPASQNLLMNAFVKTYILFSIQIPEMEAREQQQAYRICSDSAWTAGKAGSSIAKVYYSMVVLLGAKAAIRILHILYAGIHRRKMII